MTYHIFSLFNFKLAFILTFHCVPFIVCRVSLIFFLTIFHQNAIFFSSNKIVPALGLAVTHSVSEILRFRKTEWSHVFVNMWGWPMLFPQKSGREAAYPYSSVMFLHCHAAVWGIKAFLLFFFLLVATFMLILSIATWHTCLSGYWRMI